MSTSPNKSWEEEFDEESPFFIPKGERNSSCLKPKDFRWIKSFISSTLEEAVQAERERILGKLKVYSVTAPEESRAATFTVEQFRSVLDKEE